MIRRHAGGRAIAQCCDCRGGRGLCFARCRPTGAGRQLQSAAGRRMQLQTLGMAHGEVERSEGGLDGWAWGSVGAMHAVKE